MSVIRTIRDLHRRKARERRGLTLAEGLRLLEEVLEAGIPVEGAAVAPGLEGTTRGAALKQRLVQQGIPLEPVSEEELRRLADTEQPQGVVAVVAPPRPRLEQITPGAHGVVLVLDAVQDPGNVGALLRAALGLGAAGAVALPGTADLIHPRVLRGGMGASFRLPAVEAEVGAFLPWAAETGLELWAASAGGRPVADLTPRGAVGLVVGNEGAGVRPELVEAARHRVGVPLQGGVESLNVAVAAGILLYEVLRGR